MPDSGAGEAPPGYGPPSGRDPSATTDGGSSADTDDGPTKVAIACQGGGSHTAFTAGVLRRLFLDWDDEHELVGISGTSGGAFNALVAWYGLVTDGHERAAELLDSLWDDLAAASLNDRLTNDFIVGLSRVENSGMALPQVSPYQNPGAKMGQDRIRAALEAHVDFEQIADLCTRGAPELVVGAVDVNAGVFRTFTNEAVTTEAVLASAAVPDLFEAVEIDGHYHWDGLFSQNPPVDDLLMQPADRKPEELWIVQINPQERDEEPTSLEAIKDRRNELAGNISLNQELRFVERVNSWIEDGHLPASEFNHTTVRRIQIGRQYAASTKVDRSPAFLEELQDLGEQRATEFRGMD